MTLVLQRLLLSAYILICLAGLVTGTTTRGNTPPRSTTTRPVQSGSTTTFVSPARQNGFTPTRSSATTSRNATPPKSTTAVSPARLDQTPISSKASGSVASSSMRPTPTTTRSSSTGSVRLTPLTSPQNQLEGNGTTAVSVRPTPSGTSTSATVSKRDTPSSSSISRVSGVFTSFLTQPMSSQTPVVTQFSPVMSTATSMFSQPFSSTTPFMTQPPLGSSSSLGMSSLGSSVVSASMTTAGSTGGSMSLVSTAGTSGGQTNATMSTGGSVTTAGGVTNASATTGGGGGGSSTTSIGISSSGSSVTSSGSSVTSSGSSVTTQASASSPSPMPSTATSSGQQSSGSSSTSSSGLSSSGSEQSSVSSGMTTGDGGGVGPGQVIHVQIIFCNDYFNMYGPIDPNQRVGYTSQLEAALANVCGASPERIQGLFLVADPKTGRTVIQFDVVPGPGMSSDQIVVMLSNRVASRAFSLSDIYKNVLYMNCYDSPSPPIFPWTDYGPCPYQRCMNNGICKVKVTGQYYCDCRQPFTGKFCDEMGEKPKSDNKLLWLLTIPAAVALLFLILSCLCCWHRQCCCFGSDRPVKVVEVIDEGVYQDVDTRSLHSVHSCRSCASQASGHCAPMMMNDPGSTYYHALGRPFAVAFNDNTFSAVGYATNDAGLYSTTGGRRSLCGDEEIQIIMNGRGSCCGSDYGIGMGNKYAVAYNDRTFNTYSSMPRYDRIRSYN